MELGVGRGEVELSDDAYAEDMDARLLKDGVPGDNPGVRSDADEETLGWLLLLAKSDVVVVE